MHAGILFGHKLQSFQVCDIAQAGIKPASLPLWGTVVCTPDNVV